MDSFIETSSTNTSCGEPGQVGMASWMVNWKITGQHQIPGSSCLRISTKTGARASGRMVELSCQIALEANNSGFEIQRNPDKTNFKENGSFRGDNPMTNYQTNNSVNRKRNSEGYYCRLK